MAQPEPLSLAGRRVAFTTPQTTGGGYGARLHALLRQRGAHPLPVPTIAIRPHDPDRLRPFLLPGALDPFAVLAFTSSSGISAFSRALPSSSAQRPLSDAASALPFTVATLGSDADPLDGAFLTRLCRDAGRIAVLVPDVPTPAGLAEAPGRGSDRRVLYPVPDVVGLREPPVVLRLSRRAGGGRVGGRAGAGVHHMLGRALELGRGGGVLKGLDAAGGAGRG